MTPALASALKISGTAGLALVLLAGCTPSEKSGVKNGKPDTKVESASPPDAGVAAPPPPPVPGSPDTNQPEPADTTPAPGLAEIRNALEQWVFRHNNPPKDLKELVTEGYLKRLPSPPAGQRFLFDPRTMTVQLVGQ